MHHTVNVSPRLHSVYSFDYSRSSSNSSFGYVYAPDHCKPVLIRSARGNIYSSRSIMRGVVTELDRIDNTTALVNILDSMPGYSHKLRLTTNLRYRISERLNIGLNSNLNTGLQSTFLFWRNDY